MTPDALGCTKSQNLRLSLCEKLAAIESWCRFHRFDGFAEMLAQWKANQARIIQSTTDMRWLKLWRLYRERKCTRCERLASQYFRVMHGQGIVDIGLCQRCAQKRAAEWPDWRIVVEEQLMRNRPEYACPVCDRFEFEYNSASTHNSKKDVSTICSGRMIGPLGFYQVVRCCSCRGFGEVDGIDCQQCHGNGWVLPQQASSDIQNNEVANKCN